MIGGEREGAGGRLRDQLAGPSVSVQLSTGAPVPMVLVGRVEGYGGPLSKPDLGSTSGAQGWAPWGPCRDRESEKHDSLPRAGQ